MKPNMSRGAWLTILRATTETVGDCLEWKGSFTGKTPVVYVPRGYLVADWSQQRQSARVVFWILQHGKKPKAGTMLRVTCRNDACVNAAHMVCISRKRGPKEQARRGEFNTIKRKASALTKAREYCAKLTMDIAREIRASSESSRVLAERYGVGRPAINAVRSGRTWPEGAPGASVFNWRGVA